jgi:drug/metabolite transporter (DMT)-like permease
VTPGPPAPRGWFLNPYFQIFIGALCTTAGEVLFKKGANASHAGAGWMDVIGATPLASAWTWLGVIVYVISLVSWLHVLRFLPLSIAFPLINAVHILIPVGSLIFLHEKVSFGRWAGIVITLCGILMLIKPLVRAEEKL